MTPQHYIDMELSEIEALLSACIALTEAIEDAELLRQRASLITLFYIMRQKLQAAERATVIGIPTSAESTAPLGRAAA